MSIYAILVEIRKESPWQSRTEDELESQFISEELRESHAIRWAYKRHPLQQIQQRGKT